MYKNTLDDLEIRAKLADIPSFEHKYEQIIPISPEMKIFLP